MTSTSPTTKSHRGLLRPVLTVLGTLLLGLAALIALVRHELAESARTHHEFLVQFGKEQLGHPLADLKAGKSKLIGLYEPRETDALLRTLEGMPEVEGLCLEASDASEAGVRSIRTLPRLRSLTLYRNGAISDKEFAILCGMTSLESLVLTNTLITNDGLRHLKHLPNLRSLSIFCEPRLRTLDDAGLLHLKDLPKVEWLSITGGWASPEGIAKLQAQLPRCKVVTDEVSTPPVSSPAPVNR